MKNSRSVPTTHEKIRIHVGNGMPEGDIEIDASRLVVALKEIVQDYSPSTHLLKRVIPLHAAPA